MKKFELARELAQEECVTGWATAEDLYRKLAKLDYHWNGSQWVDGSEIRWAKMEREHNIN